MNFGFTEEQDLLRQEVAKFLGERCPMTEVRRISDTPAGFDRSVWDEMGELGWLGLLIPEAQGGAGLGWVDLVVLLEEAGRSLHPSPLLGAMLSIMAVRELAAADQQERWLPAMGDGSALYALALQESDGRLHPDAIALAASGQGGALRLSGEKLFVQDAESATHFIVASRGADSSEDGAAFALHVVDANAEGVEVIALPCIDSTKRLGKLVLDDVVVGEGDTMPVGAESITRLYDQAAAAVTAEAIGAAEAALALTCNYARERTQFGSPIGRFQGVKHPLAEMYVDVESFKSILYYAAWCLDERPEDVPKHVSMAKALASDAFSRIGIDIIQLHGALGYTWEYDAQLFLKRSKWVKAMFGGSDYHYARVADLGAI